MDTRMKFKPQKRSFYLVGPQHLTMRLQKLADYPIAPGWVIPRFTVIEIAYNQSQIAHSLVDLFKWIHK